MVKKQKDEGPNVNSTPNRDILQRLNFLYQASVYLQSLDPPASESHSISSGKVRSRGKNKESDDRSKQTRQDFSRKKKRKHKKKQTTGDLARSYIQCMRVVGQKTTVKIDPALKRSLCSSCNTTLIPGSSASVRIRKSSSHGHVVIYTCLHCKSSKGIPAPPTLPLNLATGTEEIKSSLLNTSTLVPGASQSESSDKTSSLPSQSQVQKEKKESKKLSSRPRLLPLFTRPDAGHVVFKGNEVMPLDQEGGLGVCFV